MKQSVFVTNMQRFCTSIQYPVRQKMSLFSLIFAYLISIFFTSCPDLCCSKLMPQTLHRPGTYPHYTIVCVHALYKCNLNVIWSFFCFPLTSRKKKKCIRSDDEGKKSTEGLGVNSSEVPPNNSSITVKTEISHIT